MGINERFPNTENSSLESEERYLARLREEILKAEETIDELHKNTGVSAEETGFGFKEAQVLSNDWLEFFGRDAEELGFTEEEGARKDELEQKLFNGELNDPGMEQALEELLVLFKRFESARDEGTIKQSSYEQEI